MPVGDHTPTSLAKHMPPRAPQWHTVVSRHNLLPKTMNEIVGSSWQTADIALGTERPFDHLMSPIKIRQAGFTGCMDTEDSVLYWLDRMQHARLLPRY